MPVRVCRLSEVAPKPASATPWRLGVALGILSCIGPLSIDLYLPAFPTMVRDLATTSNEVQRTLSAFLLALAVAQIPIGSFSDRYGRKPALYLGVASFVVISLGCALARSIDALVALRFAQGFAICAGTAVSRAMIRDLRSGPDAARLMAFTFLIIGISPVLAPLMGSYLLEVTSWRGIFVILAGVGLAGLAIARYALPESLPLDARRSRGSPIWRPYLQLLRNPRFICAALIAGLATTIPYAYVTAAPFVFPVEFHADSHAYSLLLGLDSVCSIGLAQLSPVLMRRWGARNLLVRMSSLGVAACAILAVIIESGHLSIVTFQLFSMAVFAIVGLILTPAAVSALDAGARGVGGGATAAALGTTTLAVTALASAAISLFASFSVLPLAVIVGVSLILIFCLSANLEKLT